MDGRSIIGKDDNRRGERNCMAFLSNEDVSLMRQLHAAGVSRKDCAEKFEIKIDTAHKILSGRTRVFDKR